MSLQDKAARQRSLGWAMAASLVGHGIVLFAFALQPPQTKPTARRIEASLAPKAPAIPTPPVEPPRQTPPSPQNRKQVLAVDKPQPNRAAPTAPKWTAAQKEDMNRFLDDLAGQAKASPNLAQRSLAMASREGSRQARQADGEYEILERLPNSPPVDQFSLDMYLDGLVKKLNRSAGFVRNDPRAKGVRSAAVAVRLNPDGSLLSFRILNAGDQQEEIAFIKSVVERAVPFARFPPDIQGSARSLGLVICIRPAGFGGGGFGFARDPEGRGC